MDANRNEDEVTTTSVRSSILIPDWMEAQISDISRRTLSSRSQVIRRLLAEALQREPVEAAS